MNKDKSAMKSMFIFNAVNSRFTAVNSRLTKVIFYAAVNLGFTPVFFYQTR